MRGLWVGLVVVGAIACGRAAPPAPATAAAANLLLITIDTLRADRVGAYGDATARTPAMDALAARGALFTHAYASAPITLPSHASIMTGRYPAGHGARHNGLRVDLSVPTLGEHLSREGFATAAFVAAFPLDRRFGLIKGFQTYGDGMPRGADGRPANERPGQAVVDEALAWLNPRLGRKFFLWVHLFEPHAPYGDARSGRPAEARYGDEIAEADRQVARLVAALGQSRDSTLIVVAADHGEAFGEHGEISHSLFIYDTTLRVPLIVAGPGVRAGTRIREAVGLIDIAPTIARLLGGKAFDADGVDLSPALLGAEPPPRTLYAESFAPLLDFGWSPLKSVRDGEWKYIDAPKPELFNVSSDPGETVNRIEPERARAAGMQGLVRKYSGADAAVSAKTDPEAAARLQALGYIGGGATTGSRLTSRSQRQAIARRKARAGDVR